jgi:phage tail-like protein
MLLGYSARVLAAAACLLVSSSAGHAQQVSEFPANPTRFDPYKATKFRVKGDGIFIPGISRVGPLQRQTEIVRHREGGDPSTDRLSPNRTSFSSVTLERGKSQDLAFENWSNKVWRLNAGPGAEVELKDFRKDVRVELLNEAGQVVLAYNLFRCWPFFYQALPQLDANANLVAVEAMTLACEAWERDAATVEPVEPSAPALPAH